MARGTIRLGANRYGKAAVRVVTVSRAPGEHHLRDLTVRIALEGTFDAAHLGDDNSLVIATDTMKNTAYAIAAEHVSDAAETYGIALARHFAAHAQVERVTVEIAQHRWARLPSAGGPSDHAFTRAGDYTRTALIVAEGDAVAVSAGIDGLTVLKTTQSSFAGFPRDRFTTLPETDDRILATKVASTWRYGRADLDFDALHDDVVATLLDVFASHFSPSVQNSAWLMGRAVLERHDAIDEIRFALPNLHHWLADLGAFGLANDKAVYVATSEPHGLIEVTVTRDQGR
jgi:urate oxidase